MFRGPERPSGNGGKQQAAVTAEAAEVREDGSRGSGWRGAPEEARGKGASQCRPHFPESVRRIRSLRAKETRKGSVEVRPRGTRKGPASAGTWGNRWSLLHRGPHPGPLPKPQGLGRKSGSGTGKRPRARNGTRQGSREAFGLCRRPDGTDRGRKASAGTPPGTERSAPGQWGLAATPAPISVWARGQSLFRPACPTCRRSAQK